MVQASIRHGLDDEQSRRSYFQHEKCARIKQESRFCVSTNEIDLNYPQQILSFCFRVNQFYHRINKTGFFWKFTVNAVKILLGWEVY